MKSTVILLSACILLSCNMKDPKRDGVIYKKGAEPSILGKQIVYAFQNDTVRQGLTVEWASLDKFRFTLRSANTRNGCKKELSGIAVNMFPGQDPETDQDEQGKTYPSVQYTLEGSGCQVYIRMATDKSKAQVITNVCGDEGCPLSGFGIFHKS